MGGACNVNKGRGCCEFRCGVKCLNSVTVSNIPSHNCRIIFNIFDFVHTAIWLITLTFVLPTCTVIVPPVTLCYLHVLLLFPL